MMILNVLSLQEKNVSRDAIQGKIGKVYIPDQQVSASIVLLSFIMVLWSDHPTFTPSLPHSFPFSSLMLNVKEETEVKQRGRALKNKVQGT